MNERHNQANKVPPSAAAAVASESHPCPSSARTLTHTYQRRQCGRVSFNVQHHRPQQQSLANNNKSQWAVCSVVEHGTVSAVVGGPRSAETMPRNTQYNTPLKAINVGPARTRLKKWKCSLFCFLPPHTPPLVFADVSLGFDSINVIYGIRTSP